jgi:hypothetical protein
MGRTGDIRYRSSLSPDVVADTKATVMTGSTFGSRAQGENSEGQQYRSSQAQ